MGIYSITTSLRDSAATIRKWKEFRRETGTWPVLSIVASSLRIIGFVVGGAFLIWFSEKHRWSKNHFALILLAVVLPYVFAWAWLQDKIYLGEIRRARRKRGNDSDFDQSRAALHRKSNTEKVIPVKDRGGSWSKLVAASWQIDNAIFLIFLSIVAVVIAGQLIA